MKNKIQKSRTAFLILILILMSSLPVIAKVAVDDEVIRGAIAKIESDGGVTLADGSSYKNALNEANSGEYAVGDVVYLRYYTNSDNENICLEISKTPLYENETPKQERSDKLS
jgi:hypothetical protein